MYFCMSTNFLLAEETAVQFQWFRYEGGYQWQDPKKARAQYLTSGPGQQLVNYDSKEDWILDTGRPSGSNIRR